MRSLGGVLWAEGILRGRCRAPLGEERIKGVHALGLPEIRRFVFGIFRPALAGSPLWSTIVKSFTPLDCKMDCRRATVSSTESLLGARCMPCSGLGAMESPILMNYSARWV